MTELIIEKAYIPCQVCGQDFWFEYKNEVQECPHCGQRNYRKAIPTHIKRGEAGRIGGLTTKSKYGTEFFRVNGARGGRSKLPTLTGLRQQSANEVPQDNGRRKLPNDLKGLKTLYKLRENNGGGHPSLP